MRKSERVLAEELKAAHKLVCRGGLYVHYEDPLHTYRVRDLSIGKNEQGEEAVQVVYKAQYGRRIVFNKPLDDWLKPAEHDGQTVTRYKRVESLQPEPGEHDSE